MEMEFNSMNDNRIQNIDLRNINVIKISFISKSRRIGSKNNRDDG